MPYACFCESDDRNPEYMCEPCKARGGGPRFVLEASDIAITHDSQRLGLVRLLDNMRYCSPQIDVFRDRLQALVVPALHNAHVGADAD